MIGAIRHRGPDAEGVWHDTESGLVLGHRRLSVVDLSKEGSQPMVSASGRFVVVFNGELYNFQELRLDLATEERARTWRGHSDTEVLLAAIEAWGLEESLKRFNGMFAFALWDRELRRLTVARDRFGEKPVYLFQQEGVLAFGSELKVLFQAPGWRGSIDRNALASLLRFNYIPGTGCIFQNVQKMPPASYAVFATPSSDPEICFYWSAADVAHSAGGGKLNADERSLLDELEHQLQRAVALRMHADVPLGAFLSGGIDSSMVVALMQKASARPVHTFSIGYKDPAYNEAHHAECVARHLGTDHTELIVSPRDALNVVPHLPRMFDEPYADASQIPTYLVSALARRHVTVALSGDGGDELFGGYNRHQWIPRVWDSIEGVPLPIRRALSRGLLTVPTSAWDRAFQSVGRLCGRELLRNPGDKLHKLAGVLDCGSPRAMYAALASFWRQPEQVVIGSDPQPLDTRLPWDDSLSVSEAVMAADAQTYLPDDILVKVDRASMAVSLEARVPFLDPELFTYAWQLPLDMKVRDGTSKWALRQVLYRHVPRELIDRPKSGFGIPIDSWLRGPLRDWAEALLDQDRLRQGGYFEAGRIRAVWEEHLRGRRNWQYHLWSVLMFEAWRQEFSIA